MCLRHFAFFSVILLLWLPSSLLLALLCKVEGLVCIIGYLSEVLAIPGFSYQDLDLFLDLDLSTGPGLSPTWTFSNLNCTIPWISKSLIIDLECRYFWIFD
jgi:hypothetical protein